MKRLRITLEGKTYEVGIEVLDDTDTSTAAPQHLPLGRPAPFAAAATVPLSPATTPAQLQTGNTPVLSPMAGQVFKCLVKAGDRVTQQQVVLILEAMKMETPIHAPLAGVIRTVSVKEGDAVDEGQQLLQIEG